MLQALAIIIFGLLAGRLLALVPVLDRAGEKFRRTLQITALMVLNPVAFVGALWSLPALDYRVVFFPLVGLGTLVAAFGIGALVARALKLDPTKAMLFRTGMSYTNIGNLGGLAVFQILGEAGFALVPLYKLFEELWYYGFLFPHTKRYQPSASSEAAGAVALGSAGAGVLRVLKDPFVLLVLAALALGFGLHLSGLERPAWYGPLNSVLVPTSTLLLLVSVGMSMKVSLSKEDTKPALLLALLKITLLPLVALGLSGVFGFWEMPVVWKAAVIIAAMPMAFLSMVPPALYGLDGKFTTTAWAFSMLSLVITLPLLMLLGAL